MTDQTRTKRGYRSAARYDFREPVPRGRRRMKFNYRLLSRPRSQRSPFQNSQTKDSSMRRFATSLLILIGTFAILGCGSETTTAPSDAMQSPPSESPDNNNAASRQPGSGTTN